MARKIPDIEESLQLCKDMDSPSVVIPVSNIAKHFPAVTHPSHPEIPSYDLGELKKWAKEKGWAITFAKTGTMNSIKLLPGIRFSPLKEEGDSVPDATTNPTSSSPNQIHSWYQKPVGLIGIGVIITIISVISVYLIRTHFGIPL